MPTDLVGKRVRAKVAGWDLALAESSEEFPDPSVPDLSGVPEFVDGILIQVGVDQPENRVNYTKYIVDGRDVEPDSIEELTE